MKIAELEEHEFLTVAEIAKVTRLSKMTVYRLYHAGDVSGIRIGNSIRISTESVKRYLQNSES